MPYYFRLPENDELTARQRSAVTKEGAIALTGGPGTGKSVVSVWRHITNYQDGIRKSILLTYTKSLHFYLKKSIESKEMQEPNVLKKGKIGLAKMNVNLAKSWYGQYYDEIIIDEAQDLPECEMVRLKKVGDDNAKLILKKINTFNPPLTNEDNEVVLSGTTYTVYRDNKGNIEYISKHAKYISYGADDKQILYPDRATTEARFEALFPKNEKTTLFQNFRNTYQILIFVRSVLNIDIKQTTLDRMLDDKKIGQKPVLKIVPDNLQNEAILDIINDFNDGVNNIAILFPFIRQIQPASDFLNNSKVKHTIYYNELEEINEIENVHVTTFKSVKGLEFDVVIIPQFGSFRYFIENYNVVKEEDYNVAFTRAKRNLFLLSRNDLSIPVEVLERENYIVKEVAPVAILDDLPF